MNMNPVALKEWASAINTLTEGRQIILLRKGGIEEETRRFELKSHSFYLYPTFEHQRTDLVKKEYRSFVEQSLADFRPNAPTVRLTAYAEVAADLEVHTLEQLGLLYPYHMWTEGLASERLRWKAQDPLHVLLLRVYLLDEPAEIRVLPEYSGCRSWIELTPPPEAGSLKPVLSDEEFGRKAQAIGSLLGQP
ncbi:hypothetical protein GCM10010912_18240 [Paenibacillus albidus]|uniref:DUF1802 family protein n=1 Tax=Paenibacillus albidus TaxID=2041023 RepID=A0A917C5V7_9BACL|nr:DUF1802 family protein [Paenibacillus albidus]GGF73365.1 hypothetical protein GCM10010912_18240 [Paenibacillus albidus]